MTPDRGLNDVRNFNDIRNFNDVRNLNDVKMSESGYSAS